jgi:23S rRNA (adenine2503-C2)-methyltransferase
MGIKGHGGAFAAPQTDKEGRIALIGYSLDELVDVVTSEGFPKFRAKQIWQWIYQRGVADFDDMGNIPKDMRAKLSEKFVIGRPEIIEELKSVDGTMKWLLRMSDGQEVEMVFIPEAERGTLCVSSQVGCTLTCRFCHTGTQNLVRNLGAHEIIQQIMVARDRLYEWPSSAVNPIGADGQPKPRREFTNIVLMGMGEPLYNYDNLAKAMKVAMDGDGLSISKRRITLSTSGVVPQIIRAGEELGVNLAISLHASNDELRSSIMPINNKYPLKELMDACRNYPNISNARRITFEYVMLKDVNDSDEQAQELIDILQGIPAKINLIPFNPWPGAPYERSSNNRIHRFGDLLYKAGLSAPIRKTRGEDIFAACGQLKSESQRVRKARPLDEKEKAALELLKAREA